MSKDLKAEVQYTSFEDSTNEVVKTKDDKTTENEKSIFTLPLGYGKVGLQVGTITEVGPEEELVKKGDLILIYGLLENLVESGSLLTEEQKEYAKNHPIAQIIFTKEYAKSLAKVLLAYATSSSEDDFMKRLQDSDD